MNDEALEKAAEELSKRIGPIYGGVPEIVEWARDLLSQDRGGWCGIYNPSTNGYILTTHGMLLMFPSKAAAQDYMLQNRMPPDLFIKSLEYEPMSETEFELRLKKLMGMGG